MRYKNILAAGNTYWPRFFGGVIRYTDVRNWRGAKEFAGNIIMWQNPNGVCQFAAQRPQEEFNVPVECLSTLPQEYVNMIQALL